MGSQQCLVKLQKRSKKSALVEGDTIYHLVYGGYVSPWKEGNRLEVFWKNCKDIKVAKKWRKFQKWKIRGNIAK